MFLLLLLCLFGRRQIYVSALQEADVQGTGVPPEPSVLWDELRGLKQLVLSLKAVEVEQRQALRSAESRLRDGEVEAEQQRRSLDRLQVEVEQTAGR